MEKVAIISDIHANLEALKSVLADIDANEVNKIYCLGDLALAGPMPNETIELIKSLEDKYELDIIQGNTDYMIAYGDEQAKKDATTNNNPMSNAYADDLDVVTQENKEYLKSLPINIEVELDGIRIMLVHGSVRKNDENILPNEPLEKVEEKIQGTDANIIFCGHTHIPCGYQTSTGQTVINVGSVGRPMSGTPKACYVLLEKDKDKFTIEHRLVDYDIQKASEQLMRRNFAGREQFANSLKTANIGGLLAPL